jgi:hypothetical protein
MREESCDGMYSVFVSALLQFEYGLMSCVQCGILLRHMCNIWKLLILDGCSMCAVFDFFELAVCCERCMLQLCQYNCWKHVRQLETVGRARWVHCVERVMGTRLCSGHMSCLI